MEKFTALNIAVLLGGGRGSRFGSDVPKQFGHLAGRRVIEYALGVFALHPRIDVIVLVHPHDYSDICRELQERFSFEKRILLVEGGESRAQSTRAALQQVRGFGNNKILFHDAVRPFVTQDIITDCLVALDGADAVDVTIPTADTIVQLHESSNLLKAIPPRATLRRGQTPQAFWSDGLMAAYESTSDEQLAQFTDDCAVLLANSPGARIVSLQGEESNIKITYPSDLYLAEQLLYLGKTQGFSIPGSTGRNIVILGDTSGLGLAARQHADRRGWNVMGGSRGSGVDVRDPTSLAAFMARCQEALGSIDAIVNFAGILHSGPISQAPEHAIGEMIDTNLVGSINVARAGYPYLQQSHGQLILTASSSYYRGRAGTAVYSASKAAVINLTQALSDEWKSDNISVMCLVPRRADTPMRRSAFPDEDVSLNLQPVTVAVALEELLNRRQSGFIKHIY